MRSGKELILASKEFTTENRLRSWLETIMTIVLTILALVITYQSTLPLVVRLASCLITSLLYVRIFVIYHDYQHHTILQRSRMASFIMQTIGIYLLTPQTIWKRSHDHHHSHNSKLTITGIGSYPTISKQRYLSLNKQDQRLYLINRHPLTVIMGYFTLFLYWLNIKSFVQSPKKHVDSLVSLIVHFSGATVVWYFLGAETFLIAWFIPFFLSFAMGSYLFYCQHNFPEAQFRENHDWKYDSAALTSTSLMEMNPILQWFTANIGYHHVHHLNSRIPFYRLTEAMQKMPELQQVNRTSWNPVDMYHCFRLKLWDSEKGKMITLEQL